MRLSTSNKNSYLRSMGFTIVELLIVIVVIAILAAITIVAYNGIQQRSKLTSMHTSLQSAHKLLELHKVDEGTYPLMSHTATWRSILEKTTTAEYISTSTKLAICAHSTGERYALASHGFMNTAPPTNGSPFYYISSTTGKVTTATFTPPPAGVYTITQMCSIIFGDTTSVSAWSQTLY